MKLSELIPTKSSVELTFEGNFKVVLVHTDEKMLRQLRKQATNPYSRRRGNRLDDLDDDKLIDAYAEHVIKNWSGLEEDKTKKEIPCTLEMKKKLMHTNLDFRSWVTQESGIVANFIDVSEEEVVEIEKK